MTKTNSFLRELRKKKLEDIKWAKDRLSDFEDDLKVIDEVIEELKSSLSKREQ